jgi:peptide/nickel transport system substrate-binding protein
MNAEQKYEAARMAAVEYFKAAGYTYDAASGKLTAAPEGAKLEYLAIIPGGGSGDHPSFMLLTEAKKAFEMIGINLIVNDPTDSNELWDALDAGTQEIWCAAWGATIDPDMYQVYHSNNIVGKPGSSESNHYHIADAELDNLIMEARKSDDQSYRKATYKACLDLIIDWAVEIPIYQRQNCFLFSNERIDMATVTPDITTFWGWMTEVETIVMK